MGYVDWHVLFEIVLDFASYYNILKVDVENILNKFKRDLENACRNNPEVDLLHTGSGFEGLFIPHNDRGIVLNTDADHMIILKNYEVLEVTHHVRAEAIGGDILLQNSNNTAKDGIYYLCNETTHSGYVYLSVFQNMEMHLQCSVSDIEFFKKFYLSNSEFLNQSSKSTRLVDKVLHSDYGVTGPSIAKYSSGLFPRTDRDFVFGMKLKFWPAQAAEWVIRKRHKNWPPEELILKIVTKGCHIVPVTSHAAVIPDFEWRLSFSEAELVLLELIPHELKFIYALLKTTIKTRLRTVSSNVFASYHLKTCFFWYVESIGADEMGQQPLKKSFIGLLDYLINCYKKHCVPSYFVRGNNMIDHHLTVDETLNALISIKDSPMHSICDYIDRCQLIPALFDKELTQLLQNDEKKFLTCCKYNFLLMALANILVGIKIKNKAVYDETSLMFYYKALKLHQIGFLNEDSNVYFESTTNMGVGKDILLDQVLNSLEQYLLVDSLIVTEKSAVMLGVFNIFLSTLPEAVKAVSVEAIKQFPKHPEFYNTLLWAARFHDLYCNQIYVFVVNKWKKGPVFHSTDEIAIQVSKLIMTVLGKPTKQSKAVLGSLMINNENQELMVLVMRRFYFYMLHINLEVGYIGVQAAAYLMNINVVSELSTLMKYGRPKMNQYLPIFLILSKDELREMLDENKLSELSELCTKLKTELNI